MRTLKNFLRSRHQDGGQTTWSLALLDGTDFPALRAFSRQISTYCYLTRKKYIEAVCKFLDYLFEAGAFTGELSPGALAKVVHGYTAFLHHGSAEVLRRAHTSTADKADWLIPIAAALNWRGTKREHMGNSIAGINHFLRFSQLLAQEAKERGALLGLDVRHIGDSALPDFRLPAEVSHVEIAAIRQGSMLGSVARIAPKLTRPGRLRAERGPGKEDFDGLDFPLEFIPKLVDAATNWRDRALWLLMAATGVRPSEGRNVLVEDIDFLGRKVYVKDPQGRRFPARNERSRFKGRTTAETMLHPLFADLMFDALRVYIEKVYVPWYPDGELQYLFQCIKEPWLGRPLVLVSDSALTKAFGVAAKKCGAPRAPDGKDWTPKSLRHAYGVYMLNDYPVDPSTGRTGLTLPEVQLAMGHADIRTTQTYARVKRRRLVEAAQRVDRLMLAGWSPTNSKEK